MRTTKASTSPGVRGRPAPRLPFPSYFRAISFRCQANKVSGVTMVATSARSFRPNPLALAANRPRWSSLNRTRRPPSCSRRTRFSSRRVINQMQLALVHPTGDGAQHEAERIQNSRHVVSLSSRFSGPTVMNQREFKQIQFSDHTLVAVIVTLCCVARLAGAV
jgi:hypothetical protein